MLKKYDIVEIYTDPINNLYKIDDAILIEFILKGEDVELWKVVYLSTGEIYMVCIKNKNW